MCMTYIFLYISNVLIKINATMQDYIIDLITCNNRSRSPAEMVSTSIVQGSIEPDLYCMLYNNNIPRVW